VTGLAIHLWILFLNFRDCLASVKAERWHKPELAGRLNSFVATSSKLQLVNLPSQVVDLLFELLHSFVVGLLIDNMLWLELTSLFLVNAVLPLLMEKAGDFSRRKMWHSLSEGVKVLVLKKVEWRQRLAESLLLTLNFNYLFVQRPYLFDFVLREHVFYRRDSLVVWSGLAVRIDLQIWGSNARHSRMVRSVAQEVRGPVRLLNVCIAMCCVFALSTRLIISSTCLEVWPSNRTGVSITFIFSENRLREWTSSSPVVVVARLFSILPLRWLVLHSVVLLVPIITLLSTLARLIATTEIWTTVASTSTLIWIWVLIVVVTPSKIVVRHVVTRLLVNVLSCV